VFLMEAVWTRFLPVYGMVRGWLDGGAIGELRAMQSSFCFPLRFDPNERHFDPGQAGGALLDIGIYNITVSRWVARAPVRGFDVAATWAPSGVDQRITATLDFGGGLHSQFVCALDGSAENAFRIDGTQGHIVLHAPFWQPTVATLHRTGQPPETAEAPFRVNGFEYEIEEAMRCIRTGRIESPTLPHDETIAVLELMDAMRARIGLRYPFE
jgi:predicted dehydrogenase